MHQKLLCTCRRAAWGSPRHAAGHGGSWYGDAAAATRHAARATCTWAPAADAAAVTPHGPRACSWGSHVWRSDVCRPLASWADWAHGPRGCTADGHGSRSAIVLPPDSVPYTCMYRYLRVFHAAQTWLFRPCACEFLQWSSRHDNLIWQLPAY